MRKGFLVTLATVAIALMGFNAMALAPTIGEIPDIIVGDMGPVTGTNVFVYPDAINLDSYVNDDDTLSSDITWSYSVATEPTRYTINAVQPMPNTSTLDEYINPTNRVDDTDGDLREEDSNPRTITIRDELRSPLASDDGSESPAAYPERGTGFLSDSRVVTLYASDGSTVSNPLDETGEGGIFIIYSEADGEDRYSPEEGGVLVITRDLTGGAPSGFSSSTDSGSVSATATAEGLCLSVGLTGNNDGNWRSDYGEVALVKNCVYRMRVNVTTSQTTVGLQPLWLLVYDNINDAADAGTNTYGGEVWLLDSAGGANSAISGTGRSSFDFWMAPPCFQVSYFQDETSGFFRADNSGDMDMRIILRIFDMEAAGIGAELDEGNICFTGYEIRRYDIDDMRVLSTELDDSDLTDSSSDDPFWGIDQQIYTAANHTSQTYSGGNVTLAPLSDLWTNEIILTLFRPGDSTVDFTTGGTVNEDNWPVQIAEDMLLYVQYELSAPTATDALNGPDTIRVGADVLSQEIVTDHFLITNLGDTTAGSEARGVVMPRDGGPYKYACLFNTLSPSNITITDPQRMRPRFEILCGPPLDPLGRETNTGSIRIHSVLIQEVEF
jgi:hypothetical protein